MKKRSFTTTISVDQTPNEAFAAINNVRGWWSGEIEGATDKLEAEFTYRYKDAHRSTQKVTELIPGEKIAWPQITAVRGVVGEHLREGPVHLAEIASTETMRGATRLSHRSRAQIGFDGQVEATPLLVLRVRKVR